MKSYKNFIVAVKTNFGKNIAFYFSGKFQDESRSSEKIKGFYWINGD